MSDVDGLLDMATKRLLLRVIGMMELVPSADASTSVSRLRTASMTSSFPVRWQTLLEEFQTSLYDTAFSRYHAWRYREDSD